MNPADQSTLKGKLWEAVEQAREQHDRAKNELDEAVVTARDIGLGHPDGSKAMHNAASAYNHALQTYSSALKRYSSFILSQSKQQ
jgi:hypothetical protein